MGRSSASARPFTAAIPIRSPVNDPGPTATASPSRLVTTEPSFTEGLGAVIAKHFAAWPVDAVLSTGPAALILSHCVARAHPSRPVVVYGMKGMSSGKRRVTLPVEFQRLIRESTKVLLVEDL